MRFTDSRGRKRTLGRTQALYLAEGDQRRLVCGWGGLSSTVTVRLLEERGLITLARSPAYPRWTITGLTRLGQAVLERWQTLHTERPVGPPRQNDADNTKAAPVNMTLPDGFRLPTTEEGVTGLLRLADVFGDEQTYNFLAISNVADGRTARCVLAARMVRDTMRSGGVTFDQARSQVADRLGTKPTSRTNFYKRVADGRDLLRSGGEWWTPAAEQ